MKKLTIKEIHKKTGIAVPTLSKWCRAKVFPNAQKVESPAGPYWEIPEDEWIAFEKKKGEVKPGRPKKKDE